MNTKISIATNVCSTDGPRVKNIVPSWLKVFDSVLNELLIVVDTREPEGRIAEMHGKGNLDEVMEAVRKLETQDKRVRWEYLPDHSKQKTVSEKWFGKHVSERCQAGTPILPFVWSVERSSGPITGLWACDMIFHENGWVSKAIQKLQNGDCDIVEPAQLGWDFSKEGVKIGRALVFCPDRFFKRCLPMKAHKLDVLRRIHRITQGRPPFLAFEQTLEKERDRGRINQCILDPSLGFSLHVATREEASLSWIDKVVRSVQEGVVPQAQIEAGINFEPSAWERYLQIP